MDGFAVPLPLPGDDLEHAELVAGAPSLPEHLPSARAARALSEGAPAPAPAAAEEGQEGEDRTDALAAADCSSMGWMVERMQPTSAKPLLPADLAQGQLAARRLRQAGRR